MNKSKITFIVDTLADLPPSLVQSRGDIIVVNVPVIVSKRGCNGDLIFNRLTADSFEEVDELVQQGWVSRTSLPIIYESPDEEQHGILSVERATKEALATGNDVIYLAVNSQISGTYAMVSALYDAINRENHAAGSSSENPIAVCIDTECASTGLAMLLGDTLSLYDQNVLHNFSEIVSYINNQRKKIGMLFSWFDFQYIFKSGKVAALPATLGKMFGFHPIGSVEYIEDGTRPLTTLSRKPRGTKRFFGVLARLIKATIASPSSIITVAHGNCLEKILPLIDILKIYLPTATILYGNDWRCGAAIQAHGGPTSIHINYHRQAPNTLAATEEILANLHG